MSEAALETTTNTAPASTAPASTHLEPAADSPFWRGAYTWVPAGELYQPWRLPPERARRAHAPALVEMAQMAAGVRVELITDAAALRLPLTFSYDSPGTLDLTVDGELVDRRQLTDGSHTLTWDLPEGLHEVRIWLPQVGRTTVGMLELSGGTTIEPLPARPRWVTYGSSISQCRLAAGPSETWPAIAATTRGWDLTCLGLSGQCQLDPIVERALESLEADVISLCLGINIHNAATFSERTFAAQASGFIERVRDSHPGVPIAVITPIGSPDRETTDNAVGLNLETMREALADVVAVLSEDDEHLHLVDGLGVLDVDEAHLLADGLHPGAEGYRLMGTRLAERLGALAA
ncbi:GDSL-type esterase/lipase family protein [Ruania zhangjianzhongii]|uniref:GDSL-type esterase/lipase family protein n=1 Tax=Ruania zhangjianzhongii TaxID=2603206 RepID=UPI0011CC50E9|nr:GDSL-type esterase/lipase family protein [Ruania zhangjianzhongii]